MSIEAKKEKVIEDYIAKTSETVLYNGVEVTDEKKSEALREHLRKKILNKCQVGLKGKNSLIINGKKCKVTFPSFLVDQDGCIIENLEEYWNRINKSEIRKQYEKYFPSLRSIINKKINKKEIIDGPIRYIEWKDIEFKKDKLFINLNNSIYTIEHQGLSEEHDTFKKILFRKSQEGLKVNTSIKPFKIVDSYILDTLILFLNLQIKLTNKEITVPEYIREFNSNSEFKIVLRKTISKNQYLEFLIEKHDINYPVIPVLELNNKNEEPSYIFTIKNDNLLLLIWENNSSGRATYLFYCHKDQYHSVMQNLFDFIHSELIRKRSGIVHYEKQFKEIGININFIKKIIHDDFYNWQSNIQNTNLSSTNSRHEDPMIS